MHSFTSRNVSIKKINMKKKTNKIFMYLKKRHIILVTLLLFCFSPYALNDR